jgi:hypothetical protein
MVPTSVGAGLPKPYKMLVHIIVGVATLFCFPWIFFFQLECDTSQAPLANTMNFLLGGDG